jgi:hypothetical protein
MLRRMLQKQINFTDAHKKIKAFFVLIFLKLGPAYQHYIHIFYTEF